MLYDNEIDMVEQLNEGDYKLKFSDLFEYLGVIGKGAFGIALKAKSKNSNGFYAVKVYQLLINNIFIIF